MSTDFRLWNTDQDIGVRGYVVSAPGTQATLANWSAQGDTGPIAGITGLWLETSATNASFYGYNGDLREFTGNAIRSDGAGSDVRTNLMRLEAWNKSGSGFPAVEGAATGPETWVNGN